MSEPLLDGHEALGDVPVCDRHEHGRPAAREAVLVQQAGERMRAHRWRELREAAARQLRGTHLAVTARTRSDLQLVDVVQQGGDLDEGHVDRDTGGVHETSGLGGDPGDTLAVDDDAVG